MNATNELLQKWLDKFGDAWDAGPPREGWQSDELLTLIDETRTVLDARIRSAIERKAEPVASRPTLGGMPSYGRASFSDLVKAVALAIYDREDVPIDVDLDKSIGHQMVPAINFNSLNRIVSAFSTPPAEPVRGEESATEQQLRELFGMDPEDGPLEDVIATHDGEWRKAGRAWHWHAGEELAVPYRVEVVQPLSASPYPAGESRDGLIERLVEALEWMRDRDDRNGSLPEAYRQKIDAVLAANEGK